MMLESLSSKAAGSGSVVWTRRGRTRTMRVADECSLKPQQTCKATAQTEDCKKLIYRVASADKAQILPGQYVNYTCAACASSQSGSCPHLDLQDLNIDAQRHTMCVHCSLQVISKPFAGMEQR